LLDKVDDEPDDKGKTSWVDFKKVVWHESFYKILESIEVYSKIGCWVSCGDGVPRRIFPLIVILAADYEEQYVASTSHFRISSLMAAIRCVMAHNRGYGGAAPCPRCLVKKEVMWDPSLLSLARTSAGTQALVRAANGEQQVTKREALLQPVGLRGVEVFFSLSYLFCITLTTSPRMYSGRSTIQIRTKRYRLTGSTPFLVVCFAATSGSTSRHM
jgi:hypothetical protein